MSSSAFVLQILTERGELATRFGSATLGVLLFQDISIVPLLVLLPLLEGGGLDSSATPLDLITKFGPTAAMTLGGLGVLLLGGSFVLRQVFAVVAKSGIQETFVAMCLFTVETFVAMCLFTVAGAALLTESMGFSDTLGAFIAGFLLSETNFKTQIEFDIEPFRGLLLGLFFATMGSSIDLDLLAVEADIKPFRGLLLGLFFVTTGSSIDLNLLAENWQLIAWMLAGLLSIKTVVIASLGIASGLSRNEAIHLGFTLSQGGEFAFVLLSLAKSLHLLPKNEAIHLGFTLSQGGEFAFVLLSLAKSLHLLPKNKAIHLGFTLSQGGEFAFVLLSLVEFLHLLPKNKAIHLGFTLSQGGEFAFVLLSLVEFLHLLPKNEAIHLGFTLSQGGEFAFVLLSLAESLHLLPESLNQILLITVVLSMALTPALETGGKAFADYIDDMSIRMMPPPRRVDEEQLSAVPYDENLEMKLAQLSAVPYDENLEMKLMRFWMRLKDEKLESKLYESPVVICGFGLQGQMLANMLESPLLGGAGGTGRPYIAFDTQADRVRVARAQGFSVFYGDGTQPEVLAAAGVKRPQSLVVTLGGRASTVNAVATLRAAYPDVPIYACGKGTVNAVATLRAAYPDVPIYACGKGTVNAVATLRAAYPDVPIYACGKGVQHAAQLEAAGATRITLAPTEAGVALASELMEYLGVSGDDLINLREGVNDALEVQTHKMAFSLKSLRPASSIELLVLDKELHAARVKENMARRSALEKTAV
eukprot:gene21741-28763_t